MSDENAMRGPVCVCPMCNRAHPPLRPAHLAGVPLRPCERCGRTHNHAEAAELREKLMRAEERAEDLQHELRDAERLGKYYVKARVYGAMAAHWSRALKALADAGNVAAKKALAWRYSERSGVPAEDVGAIGELLDAATECNRLREKLTDAEKDAARAWARVKMLEGVVETIRGALP